MATFSTPAVVLEMVQKMIDARRPSESETDMIIRAFNVLRHALQQCQGWSAILHNGMRHSVVVQDSSTDNATTKHRSWQVTNAPLRNYDAGPTRMRQRRIGLPAWSTLPSMFQSWQCLHWRLWCVPERWAPQAQHLSPALPAGPKCFDRCHRITSMVLTAPRAHGLAAPHSALLRASQFKWFGNNTDSEAVACLPLLAKPIGDVLRRPGVIRDLHAAEPYAGVSLVLTVLQAVFSLPKTPLGDELRRQALGYMRCAAGHCLE